MLVLLPNDMYSGGILSISEVNALTSDQFEWLFGNVIEHHSNAAQHVASLRPFKSVKRLKKCFFEYLDKFNATEKENVLLSYPDFVEKLVGETYEESFTAESQFGNSEFASMSAEKKQSLSTYNDLYKEKFRIPFVVHVPDNKVQTVFASIHARLQNTRDCELNIAMHEIKKICNSRINHLVWSDVQ